MHSYCIKSDLPGRLRIRYGKYVFDEIKAQALTLYIREWENVKNVEINYKNGSILFLYDGDKENLLNKINELNVVTFDVNPYVKEIEEMNSSSYKVQQKEMNDEYLKRFRNMVIRRYAVKWFLPAPIRYVLRLKNACKYFKLGFESLSNGRIDVPVLDATSIGVSFINNNVETAGNIMFLLSISELLEEYTKKKSSLQLKESLAFNIDQVWVLQDGNEVLIPSAELKKGDIVIVQMGSMISIDGEIVDGEGMINEASFTGEPLSKAVGVGSSVYAGTIVEEGKIFVRVRNLQSETRINKIVDMIDTNESLKASIQANAEHLADSLVPYSFLGFFGILLFTRNLTKATSILLVDYSCAIKLSTSISVISAMQEAGNHSIMVKGGKYLEAMANADTIVFDKTGTLTNATPFVQQVVSCDIRYTEDQILNIAACLEEHFPHSVANAIVKEAKNRNLSHTEEDHAKVEYVVAHGIATTLYGQRAIIGSAHFVFEDEGVEKSEHIANIINDLECNGSSSMIYLAIDGICVGIISIFDPVKEEAKEVIDGLRNSGFSNIVMLTGDSENAAKHVASELGIDSYRAQVLPEDKASYVKQLKEEGHTVVMVGDGVNDTPALSSSDVSISMQDSSDIARELADVTLLSSNLNEIVVFKQLSKLTMNRIHTNYRNIATFNTSLIVLGVMGVLQPSMSALLHNSSTLLFGISSARKYLEM